MNPIDMFTSKFIKPAIPKKRLLTAFADEEESDYEPSDEIESEYESEFEQSTDEKDEDEEDEEHGCSEKQFDPLGFSDKEDEFFELNQPMLVEQQPTRKRSRQSNSQTQKTSKRRRKF